MIVNLVGNSIEVKASSSAVPEYFALADISNVFSLFIPAPTSTLFGTGWPDIYPYPTRTEVIISFSDGYKPALKIELQKIDAGALMAFNSGTQADLINATALINSWI